VFADERTLLVTTGQWMEEDRIMFEGDPSNLRRYVGNNATNAVDPSGLDPESRMRIIERQQGYKYQSEEWKALLLPLAIFSAPLGCSGQPTKPPTQPAESPPDAAVQGSTAFLDIYVGQFTTLVVDQTSKKTGVQHYGGGVMILYSVSGKGSAKGFTFHRTVQDHVEFGNKIEIDDKAPKPDGPPEGPPWTGMNKFRTVWDYNNLDIPTLGATKENLPAKKVAIYRFWVEDAAKKVIADKTVKLTIEIDAAGKTTYSTDPKQNSTITILGEGKFEAKKQ
jgi:hypothetical protein